MGAPILRPPMSQSDPLPAEQVASRRYLWLATLVAGYIGIYLCRKNFSVAIPLLQQDFKATRAELGAIASYSTIAYAVGKFVFGAAVDRVGGRTGFLASMLGVCAMGIAGGLAPSLGILAIFYSMNRLFGSAGWPAMVKLTPHWFTGAKIPFAMALLSLSFVAGGAFATLFAGLVAKWSNGSWRAVMAVPSAVLFALILASWWILPRAEDAPTAPGEKKSSFTWENIAALVRNGQFFIVCALSFTLTLMRETFNTWTVDFIKTQGGADVSNQIAAFLSTPYDILGAVGILVVGSLYGRLENRGRHALLFGMLALLAVLIYNLPAFFKMGLTAVTIALAVIGFLVYGPYSLLAGALSVEVGGAKSAATVSGLVDGVGYVAGILAGKQFGRLVDLHGYNTGFAALAALAFVSAFFCLFLRKRYAS